MCTDREWESGADENQYENFEAIATKRYRQFNESSGNHFSKCTECAAELSGDGKKFDAEDRKRERNRK